MFLFESVIAHLNFLSGVQASLLDRLTRPGHNFGQLVEGSSSANIDDDTWARAFCPTYNESANDLKTLERFATASVLCPMRDDVYDAKAYWLEWWINQNVPVDFTADAAANRFLHYVTQRSTGNVIEHSETFEFESNLVKKYKNVTYIADSSCGYREILKASQLALEAKRVRTVARELKKGYRETICVHTKFGSRDLDHVFGAAVHAIRCADQRPRVLELAAKWRVWWDSKHKSNPCDERSDAERFLMYAIDRLDGLIGNNDDTIEFERGLAQDFIEANEALADSGEEEEEEDDDNGTA